MKQSHTEQADFSAILEKLKSPEGQRLLELLQTGDVKQRKAAAQQAARGDYTEASKLIDSLMANPEASALIQKLRGE